MTGAPEPDADMLGRRRASRPARRRGPAASSLPVEEIHLADEVGDERRRRLRVDLVGRADLVDPALAHDDDAVGHRERFLLVVRHHDRGDAEPLLQVADFAAQPRAHARVERRERLVEQQQARRQRQRAGERDALLLAAGKLRRVFFGLVGEADQRQQLGDARWRSRARVRPTETSP